MSNTTSSLLPATEDLLKEFGARLRLARLRRHLQAKEVAERTGMTEVTLRRVERGLPGVTIGAYLAVMQVLQLQNDVAQWATDDFLGRHLQDADLQHVTRSRRTRFPTKPGDRAVSSGKVMSRVEHMSPRQVMRTEKDDGAPLEEEARSVSANDLFKAIRLPPTKHSSGKAKVKAKPET
jgi:transcriptional regulator with XRE-family HTH domain